MNTHADKTQENKSQSVANAVVQKKSSNESAFQFVDNRPESIAQQKLQEAINNSPRVQQLSAYQEMANNSPQAKQAAQLQSMANSHSTQQQPPIQKKENNTGLPDHLKTGVENLSGYSMDDVKVHYNSDKPAQLLAHAYAQGTDIHLAPRQEKHLPHEAWHVVQQNQGRVKPTVQLKAEVPVNDDVDLETEADVMGAKALLQRVERNPEIALNTTSFHGNLAQHVGNAPLQKKVHFLETSNEIRELSQTIIAKKDDFRKVLPDEEFTGNAKATFEGLFKQYAGPVYATLARLQRSKSDYGKFNLSDPQSLTLLYYEIKKSKDDAHPKGNFVASVEDTAADKKVKETEEMVDDIKANLPARAFFYKTALLGAGASVAYYITANASSLDMASTVVIGNLQPWANDRGKEGRVNHPRHVISPNRDKSGPQPEDDVLMSRKDFSTEIQKILVNSGAKLIQTYNISKVVKVSIKDKEVSNQEEGGINLYKIEAGSTVFYALDVVAGLGAGPHNEVNTKPGSDELIGDTKDTLNEKLKIAKPSTTYNRVMNLDEFQQNASGIYDSIEEGKEEVIFISGGSAAIDAVTRIIAENDKEGKGRNKLKLIWAQGSRGAQFLEGTDNEATKDGHKPYLKNPEDSLPSSFNGRTGKVSVNGTQVKIEADQVTYTADWYVHAQGQNTQKLKLIFDEATVLDMLAPTYDRNREFGTNALLPSVIGAEVGASNGDKYKTSMKFIGATAESLLADKKDLKYEGVKMATAYGLGNLENPTVFTKLQEVISTLPINVLTNAQLAPSRSQVEAEASFVPSYVTKDIDFATDSRTVIAIHIAAKYQNLNQDDANYWANRIVEARRPSYGDIKGTPLLSEGLLGPIPNPYGKSRETTKSFSAAFTKLLQEANLAAKK